MAAKLKGLAVKGLPLLMAVGLPLVLGYLFVHNSLLTTRDVIASTSWQPFQESGLFVVKLPGKPNATAAFFADVDIDGYKPSKILAWRVQHNNAYFYVGVTEYPPGVKITADVFRRLADDLKRDILERTIVDDQSIKLEERPGRQWEFTRPYTSMRVFIDGQRIFVLATDWLVLADRKIFLDSFNFPAGTTTQ